MPYLTGQAKESPRKFFMYLSDDGDVLGMRYDNWKMGFMEQRCQGTLQIWAEPFTRLRIPKIFNLRTDPYERADQTSNTYWEWYIRSHHLLYGAQAARRPMGGDVQGLPAGSEAQHLYPRRRIEDDARNRLRNALNPAFGFGRQAFGLPPVALDIERPGAGAEAGNPRRSEMSRSEEVRDFYERMPYPAPRTSLDTHRDRYKNPDRRRAEFHLMWPAKQPRGGQEILIAGCGTSQAARYALLVAFRDQPNPRSSG